MKKTTVLRLWFNKSGRPLDLGDKHRTSRPKGVFYLLDGLACDLEQMAPGAEQFKKKDLE